VNRYFAAGLVVLLALTGCAATPSATEPAEPSQVTASAEPSPEPTETVEPLVAEDPTLEVDVDTYLTFVRGRLASFPSQIPDATDEQLVETGWLACERILGGESPLGMTVIDGEKPSEIGGYYYDSNAIVAGAQIHLCPETL